METRRSDGRCEGVEFDIVEMRRTAGNSGPGKCGVAVRVSSLMVLDFLSTGGLSDSGLLDFDLEFEFEFEFELLVLSLPDILCLCLSGIGPQLIFRLEYFHSLRNQTPIFLISIFIFFSFNLSSLNWED